MDTRDELCATTIARIFLQQKSARLLVQRRLGIGVYKQAFDGDEDVSDSVLRLPILLQGVDADLAVRANVRMENLGCEPTYLNDPFNSKFDHRGIQSHSHFGGAAGNSFVKRNFTLK